MHGLGSHDDHHSESHVPWAVAVTFADADSAAAAGHSHADDTNDVAKSVGTAVTAPVDSAPASDDGSESGEALAILVPAFGLLLALTLTARGRRPIAVRSHVREQLLLLGRRLDPPCLYRLSILRC